MMLDGGDNSNGIDIAKHLLDAIVHANGSRHVVAATTSALWRSIMSPTSPKDTTGLGAHTDTTAHACGQGSMTCNDGLSFGKLAEFIVSAK